MTVRRVGEPPKTIGDPRFFAGERVYGVGVGYTALNGLTAFSGQKSGV